MEFRSIATPALLEAISTPALLYSRSRLLVAGNEAGRALLKRHTSPDQPSRLGDLALDVLLSRVLRGDETLAGATARLAPPLALQVRATRVQLPELGRHALLELTEIAALEADPLAPDRARMLARLLPGITHEVRSPLTTISGVAQVLSLGPGLDADAREALNLVPYQVDRADRLLRNVTAFVAGPSHTPELPASIQEAVERALELVAYDLRLSQVRVEMTLHPDVPPVAAPAENLLHLVLNLILVALERLDGSEGPRQLRLATSVGEGRLSILEIEAHQVWSAGPDAVPEIVRVLLAQTGGKIEHSTTPGGIRFKLTLPGSEPPPGTRRSE